MAKQRLIIRATLVFFVMFNVTHAADYVGRALTTCAPVKGTSREGPCMTDAAKSICGGLALQASHGCYKDFERYHLSRVQQVEMEREAFNADTKRRIERLKAKAGLQ